MAGPGRCRGRRLRVNCAALGGVGDLAGLEVPPLEGLEPEVDTPALVVHRGGPDPDEVVLVALRGPFQVRNEPTVRVLVCGQNGSSV